MLGGLEFMHNGVMPPFAGTDAERAALAAYLSSIQPVSAAAAAAATDGKTSSSRTAAMCHRVSAGDSSSRTCRQESNRPPAKPCKDLTSLFPLMPDLKLSDAAARLAGAVDQHAAQREGLRQRHARRKLNMMQPNLIPTLDPNPLPAPYWVFKLLLIVTFFLHIVAMNFMLGGGVLALAAKWRSKNRESGNRMFFDVAKKLPVLLPATITLGIAPLLFVQVLYGQFFYTSSILMAWPWFLVLVFLTIAYYGFYYVSFQSGRQSGQSRRRDAVQRDPGLPDWLPVQQQPHAEPDARALGGRSTLRTPPAGT